MACAVKLSGFPALIIDPGDVSGSWRRWKTDFMLSIRLRAIEMGSRIVRREDGEVEVPNFREEAKVLILLQAVGNEGRDILLAEGLTVESEGITFTEVMGVLCNHYEREESLYVKTQNFVGAQQLTGEDQRDYLKRVERLGRELDIFRSSNEQSKADLEKAREQLTLVIAVNGLRDQGTRRDMIANCDLTWKSLQNVLKSRSKAQETVEKLGKAVSHLDIKQEVGVICIPGDKDKVEGELVNEVTSRQRRDGGYNGPSSRDRYWDRSVNRSSSRDRENRRSSFRDSRSPSRGSWSNHRSPGRDRSRRYSRSPSVRSNECLECGSTSHRQRYCPNVECYRCGGKAILVRTAGIHPLVQGVEGLGEMRNREDARVAHISVA